MGTRPEPGSFWIEETEFHFLDGSGTHWKYEGKKARDENRRLVDFGIVWIEGERLCYTPNDSFDNHTYYHLPTEVKDSNVVDSVKGSIWIESGKITYIDESDRKVPAFEGQVTDDHTDDHNNHRDHSDTKTRSHTDGHTDRWGYGTLYYGSAAHADNHFDFYNTSGSSYTDHDDTHTDNHNWKSEAARDRFDPLLGRFVEALNRAREAAIADPDHPRLADVRTTSHDEVIETIDRVPADWSVAHRTRADRAEIAIATPAAEVSAERLLDDPTGPGAQRARGVPACCARHHEGRADTRVPPVVEIAGDAEDRIDGFDPRLNVIWAPFGWRFVEFWPCAFDCENASRVAGRTAKHLREIDSEATTVAETFLGAEASWSGYHGLAHLQNPWCLGTYDAVAAHHENRHLTFTEQG